MNQNTRIPFLPFSDHAAKAFGSKRPDPSSIPVAVSEFTDSARKAFHSNRSKVPKEASAPFPSAFGGTARAPRTEFDESAAMAFGGGGARRSDFDDTASYAFGGANRSGFSERESSAFGRKERRRPIERPSLPKAPLTAAEQLVSQVGSSSSWSNSALSTAPATVSEVLKNEEVFPTLGSASGKQKPVPKKAVAVAVAPSAPKASGLTLAEKTKVWSDQTDQQRQREAAQHEREALIRAADERQANVFRSYAKQRPAYEEDEEDEEY